jgi:hypothetical protein
MTPLERAKNFVSEVAPHLSDEKLYKVAKKIIDLLREVDGFGETESLCSACGKRLDWPNVDCCPGHPPP